MDPVKDSRFFFDLKRKFEVILEEVEKNLRSKGRNQRIGKSLGRDVRTCWKK